MGGGSGIHRFLQIVALLRPSDAVAEPTCALEAWLPRCAAGAPVDARVEALVRSTSVRAVHLEVAIAGRAVRSPRLRMVVMDPWFPAIHRRESRVGRRPAGRQSGSVSLA